MITPDAIALWRQMQSLNYRPAAAFIEKDLSQHSGGRHSRMQLKAQW